MASAVIRHDPADIRAVDTPTWSLGLGGESLLVLTHDKELVKTLRTLTSQHELVLVGAEADLASRLMGGDTGVIVLDTAAAVTPVAELARRVKIQFPEIVLVVAGGAPEQATLAPQIASGTVYRFLHKPVSEQRVKLFVDAAWRRRLEDHAGASQSAPRAESGASSALPRWIWIVAVSLGLAGAAALGWRPVHKTAVSVHAAPVQHAPAKLPPSTQPAIESAPPVQTPAVASPVPAPVPIQTPPPVDADLAARKQREAVRALLSRQELEQQRVSDEVSATESDLGQLVLAAAHTAFDAGKWDEAQHWIAAATELDADHAQIVALTRDIDLARITSKAAADAAAAAAAPEREAAPPKIPAQETPQERPDEIVSASTLERLSYVAPAYPSRARDAGTRGWVDLTFLVTTDGRVEDVAVVDAEPRGVFDENAVAALRKWRYRPVEREGQPVAQHAKLRIRFTLQ